MKYKLNKITLSNTKIASLSLVSQQNENKNKIQFMRHRLSPHQCFFLFVTCLQNRRVVKMT